MTDYLWTKSIEIEPRNIDSSQKKKLSVSYFFILSNGDITVSYISILNRRER